MDFMGFNGKQQSHSVIQFELVRTPDALDTYAYPCNTLTPSNGSFANFTNVGNCSCATCDLSCPAPPVDASIGFFDGFDGVLVAIVYGILIVFSIAYTVIKQNFLNKDDSLLEEDFGGEDNPNDSNAMVGSNNPRVRGGPKINNSEVSSANNSQLIPPLSNARLLEGQNN